MFLLLFPVDFPINTMNFEGVKAEIVSLALTCSSLFFPIKKQVGSSFPFRSHNSLLFWSRKGHVFPVPYLQPTTCNALL